MAKSSDVGAVSVPRKLTLAERLVLVGPGIAHNVGTHAAARLAFLESLVQDVAKVEGPWRPYYRGGTADTDSATSFHECSWCGVRVERERVIAGMWGNKKHPANDCPYPRLLAAVSDDREDGK